MEDGGWKKKSTSLHVFNPNSERYGSEKIEEGAAWRKFTPSAIVYKPCSFRDQQSN